MDKQITEMNVLELKGMLFDLDSQVKQIQTYAQTKIVPILNKKIEEEKQNPNNKPSSVFIKTKNQSGGVTDGKVEIKPKKKKNGI